MKKLKQTVLVLATVGMVSVQAQAAEMSASRLPTQQLQAVFSQQDIQGLFDQGEKPMQLAALPSSEMQETQGAFIPLVLGGMAMNSLISSVYYAATHRASFSQAGLRNAALAGAITGAIGGPLVRAAGGFVTGNIAWRPGLLAANNSIQRGLNHYGFNR
ncbi:MAG: hypothetical protein Q4B17_09540 [Lautropia sp.]|nr:hypothetical protein [Lautropia sp.]